MSCCCAKADAEVAAAQTCCQQNARTPGIAPPAPSRLRSGCLTPRESPAQRRASWRRRLPQQAPRSTTGGHQAQAAPKTLRPAGHTPRKLGTLNARFAARLRRGERGRSMVLKPSAVSRHLTLHRSDRKAVLNVSDTVVSTEVNCLQGPLVAPQACTVASSCLAMALLDMLCSSGHHWVAREPAQRPRTRGLPYGLWLTMAEVWIIHAIQCIRGE